MNYDLDNFPVYHCKPDDTKAIERLIDTKLADSNAIQRKQLELILQQQKMLEDMKADSEKESALVHAENKRNYKFNITNTILVALTLLVAVSALVVSVIAL